MKERNISFKYDSNGSLLLIALSPQVCPGNNEVYHHILL